MVKVIADFRNGNRTNRGLFLLTVEASFWRASTVRARGNFPFIQTRHKVTPISRQNHKSDNVPSLLFVCLILRFCKFDFTPYISRLEVFGTFLHWNMDQQVELISEIWCGRIRSSNVRVKSLLVTDYASKSPKYEYPRAIEYSVKI